MDIKMKYLKDEDGEIISPITSSNSVFIEGYDEGYTVNLTDALTYIYQCIGNVEIPLNYFYDSADIQWSTLSIGKSSSLYLNQGGESSSYTLNGWSVGAYSNEMWFVKILFLDGTTYLYKWITIDGSLEGDTMFDMIISSTKYCYGTIGLSANGASSKLTLTLNDLEGISGVDLRIVRRLGFYKIYDKLDT